MNLRVFFFYAHLQLLALVFWRFNSINRWFL